MRKQHGNEGTLEQLDKLWRDPENVAKVTERLFKNKDFEFEKIFETEEESSDEAVKTDRAMALSENGSESEIRV
jgi:hypothetical protein